MEKKKTDLLEKGAILQRDLETYAIAPHFPGGICTPQLLRKLAELAEKYNAQTLKLTSAQRVAIVGIREEDLDAIWEDLGIKPGAAIGLCVRSIKFCPGTTFCKLGITDAVGIGSKLDETYHAMPLPSKFKMGVSGCTRCCGESWVKDLGLIGSKKGWEVVVGGNAGAAPQIASSLAKGLDDEQALALVDKVMNFYKTHTKSERIGRLIKRIGIDTFKKEIGI